MDPSNYRGSSTIKFRSMGKWEYLYTFEAVEGTRRNTIRSLDVVCQHNFRLVTLTDNGIKELFKDVMPDWWKKLQVVKLPARLGAPAREIRRRCWYSYIRFDYDMVYGTLTAKVKIGVMKWVDRTREWIDYP